MRLLARWVVLGLAAGLAGPAGAQDPTPVDPLSFPEAQRAFLQDGPGLLLTAAQRESFLAGSDAERDRFIADFLRDPDPATPSNELTDAIERRQRLTTAEFATPLDVRAKLMFLNGKPDERTVVACALVFRPLEVWTYRGEPNQKGIALQGRVLLYQPAVGEPYRAWRPVDGKRVLYSDDMEFWMSEWEAYGGRSPRIDIQVCKQAELIDRVTGIAALTGHSKGRGRVETPNGPVVSTTWSYSRPWPWGRATAKPEGFLDPPSDRAGWAKAAAAGSAPGPLPTLAANALAMDFPRRDGQRLVARSVIRLLAAPPLAPVLDGNRSVYKVTVAGVVELDGKPFEELRLRFRTPVGAGRTGGELPLSIETTLRPGQTYLLRLRVTDDASGGELRQAKVFSVPAEPVETLSQLAPVAGEAIPAPLAGANALVLLPPPDEVALGLWRAEALVAGPRIAKVVFSVDGESQLVRTRPPYEAELRLASPPKEQTIRAEGFDEAGVLVASDQFAINHPRGAFAAAITSPAEGAKVPPGPVLVHAEVSAPDGHSIESVEFHLDGATLQTLTKPPWEARVNLPAGGALAYLTVVATLDDGTRTEAVRLLNAPEDMAHVEVDLVEVFTAVTDGGGEYVRGLAESDFSLRENDREQAIQKFEPVENLPLILGFAMDVSGSMGSSLGEAERAASGFLSSLVKPRDKVFALSFADRPTLLVSPTDDLGAVRAALDSQRALGGTALHDAIVSALFYFRGQHGQKALIVLSDGDDNDSKLKWPETLDYARRSGVAVYTIALGVRKIDFSIRGKLGDLATATGGRAFFIDKAAELVGVYGEIERELRSRYLLAYASDQAAASGGFRKIDVEVKKRGLKARSARGYYP